MGNKDIFMLLAATNGWKDQSLDGLIIERLSVRF